MQEMVATYKRRCQLITSRLDKVDGISYIKPSGAFYIFIDLSRVKENYPYEDSFSVKFCEDFLNDERVAIIPGKAFGTDDYVRISYACHEDDFLEGIDRLERYIKKYL